MRELEPENESSSDRYEKLKKEQAGTENSEAEERFQKLKEEAKKEFIQKQKEREKEKELEEVQDSGKFITY